MDLTDLYPEVIRDHSRRPRHFGELSDATGRADGHNPICGDRVCVFVRTEAGRVTEARFTGTACALCTASASIMTGIVRGHSTDEARGLAEAFADALTSPQEPDLESGDLIEAAPLAGVRRFPMRVKCVTLPWHALKAALDSDSPQTSPVIRTE